MCYKSSAWCAYGDVQIGVLPGEGGGGTPLTNSVELDRARTPDTEDGLHFTDLFTVTASSSSSSSQAPHQDAGDNTALAASQNQPPPHCPPNLFLATDPVRGNGNN